MPKRYIPALVIFVALIWSTIYFYKQESSYIVGMTKGKGVVVLLGDKSTSSISFIGRTTTTNTQAIVDFEANNLTYRIEGRGLAYPRWKIDQTVDIYFSQENPTLARINRWDELYFFTILSSFFLGCLIFFATLNFIVYKIRGRPLS